MRTKGLTIVGDGAVPMLGKVIVRDLPAGEEVVLRGLLLGPVETSPGSMGARLALEDNAGTVWVEDCTIYPDTSVLLGVFADDCASVVLVRTQVLDPTPFLPIPFFPDPLWALRARNSQVHVFESLFQGSPAAPFGSGSVGGDAALLQSSFLFATGSTFVGGPGSEPNCFDGNCLSNGFAGGTGLDATSAAPAPITLACSFQGGAGGPSTICGGVVCGAPGPVGPPFVGAVVEEDLPLRAYEVTSPVRGGTTYQVSAQCQPGEFVWSMFADDLAPAYVPLYFGTQVGALPVTLVFEGSADATGALERTVKIPPLAGLTSFERLFAQGLFFDALHNAYLGSPSVLLVVN